MDMGKGLTSEFTTGLDSIQILNLKTSQLGLFYFLVSDNVHIDQPGRTQTCAFRIHCPRPGITRTAYRAFKFDH